MTGYRFMINFCITFGHFGDKRNREDDKKAFKIHKQDFKPGR